MDAPPTFDDVATRLGVPLAALSARVAALVDARREDPWLEKLKRLQARKPEPVTEAWIVQVVVTLSRLRVATRRPSYELLQRNLASCYLSRRAIRTRQSSGLSRVNRRHSRG